VKEWLLRLWMRWWMTWAGHGVLGRLAMHIASWAAPPHRARNTLAKLSPAGYIARSATRYHPHAHLGEHIFIGDRVVLFSRDGTGRIVLADRVHLYQESFLETGEGGEIHIGRESSIHARCQLMAYKGTIRIGSGVAIAQGSALYPYDHGMDPGRPIRLQPLVSKGDIDIGDEAWLGTGVIVLAGVRIGSGAVIAAGSVVTRDVPDNAIAAGVPARVITLRGSTTFPQSTGHAARDAVRSFVTTRRD
jgi:acetyltransferase-like isoleucine patch superfamily enzyme